MKYKIIILGHENPDVDSIISGYLLEKIYNKLYNDEFEVEFIIPDENIDKESYEICLRYGIDAKKFQKNLPIDGFIDYILVDHYEDGRINKNPVKIIDHHPTIKTLPNHTINTKCSSTALQIFTLYKNQYQFFYDDIKKIVLASYIDTTSLKSTKTTQKDILLIKKLINKYQLDSEKLYEEGLCLTKLDDIKKASFHGLKKYRYGQATVCSSYIQIRKKDHDIISNILKECQKYLKQENLDCFVFIEHDMDSFNSTVYFITPNNIDIKKYNSFTSRGSTIMPVIEEIFTNKTVFISSSSKNHNEYQKTAREIVNWLQSQNYTLSSSACNSELMSGIYNIFSTNEKNIDTTFDRTKSLYNNSDIIIFLPGGTETLSEIFSCLEENRTTDTPKSMILFNQNHYYDTIIEIINNSITEGLNDSSIYDYIKIANSKEELQKMVLESKKDYEVKKIKKYTLKND